MARWRGSSPAAIRWSRRIHGLCVGGGLELALDLRSADRRAPSARFGIPVKRLGLVVAYAELEPLVQLVGPANAMEILLEGRIFGADEALRMGLINRVVADAELDAEVAATTARIAEGAPLVARWHKKFTRRLLQPAPLSPEELDESYHCFGTEDFRDRLPGVPGQDQARVPGPVSAGPGIMLSRSENGHGDRAARRRALHPRATWRRRSSARCGPRARTSTG